MDQFNNSEDHKVSQSNFKSIRGYSQKRDSILYGEPSLDQDLLPTSSPRPKIRSQFTQIQKILTEANEIPIRKPSLTRDSQILQSRQATKGNVIEPPTNKETLGNSYFPQKRKPQGAPLSPVTFKRSKPDSEFNDPLLGKVEDTRPISFKSYSIYNQPDNSHLIQTNNQRDSSHLTPINNRRDSSHLAQTNNPKFRDNFGMDGPHISFVSNKSLKFKHQNPHNDNDVIDLSDGLPSDDSPCPSKKIDRMRNKANDFVKNTTLKSGSPAKNSTRKNNRQAKPKNRSHHVDSVLTEYVFTRINTIELRNLIDPVDYCVDPNPDFKSQLFLSLYPTRLSKQYHLVIELGTKTLHSSNTTMPSEKIKPIIRLCSTTLKNCSLHLTQQNELTMKIGKSTLFTASARLCNDLEPFLDTIETQLKSLDLNVEPTSNGSSKRKSPCEKQPKADLRSTAGKDDRINLIEFPPQKPHKPNRVHLQSESHLRENELILESSSDKSATHDGDVLSSMLLSQVSFASVKPNHDTSRKRKHISPSPSPGPQEIVSKRSQDSLAAEKEPKDSSPSLPDMNRLFTTSPYITRSKTKKRKTENDSLDNLELSIDLPDTGKQSHELLFVYPFEGNHGVSVFQQDRCRLLPKQFLNDSIIEFYLKYLLTKVPQANSIQLLSSFLYNVLDKFRDEPDTGFEKVKSWTRKINLLSKRYIVIPINEQVHWYLVIIGRLDTLEDYSKYYKSTLAKDDSINAPLKPSSLLNPPSVDKCELIHSVEQTDTNTTKFPPGISETQTDPRNSEVDKNLEVALGDPEPKTEEEVHVISDSEESNNSCAESKKIPLPPWIAVLDSLNKQSSDVINTFRNYILRYVCETVAIDPEDISPWLFMNPVYVDVPQQKNTFDCGVFLLEFAEFFFNNLKESEKIILNSQPKIPSVLGDFSQVVPIPQRTNWRVSGNIAGKRKEIIKLIDQLTGEYINSPFLHSRDAAHSEQAESEVEFVE